MAKRPEVHEARKLLREIAGEENEEAAKAFFTALGMKPGSDQFQDALRLFYEMIREQKRPIR